MNEAEKEILEEPLAQQAHLPLEGVDEEAWIEVIRKMDQVYSDLLEYQVALEEKNRVLEETQKFVESVLGSMSDVLLVCDQYGKVLEANSALCQLVGRPQESLIGTPVSSLFHDADARARFDQSIGTAHCLQDWEAQLTDAEGQPIPVAFNCSKRHSPQGRPLGMVLIGRPIGELRRAYETVQHTLEQLQRTQQQLIHSEKMASLGRLVAGVAHELNNPISFVHGNVFALKRYLTRIATYIQSVDAATPATRMEELKQELRIGRILDDMPSLLDGTMEGAERCRAIVDGLKRFSVMDRDEELEFNLAEIVRRSVHWVDKASAHADFVVTLEIPDEIPVRGNPGHLQQVVTNLVQNAFDACVGANGSGRLVVSGTLTAGRVHLSFSDDGPGIAEAHLPHLFDPFFTTKPIGQGTGLGLSISYGIVEQMGGQLTAANGPDGGARFDLELAISG